MLKLKEKLNKRQAYKMNEQEKQMIIKSWCICKFRFVGGSAETDFRWK